MEAFAHLLPYLKAMQRDCGGDWGVPSLTSSEEERGVGRNGTAVGAAAMAAQKQQGLLVVPGPACLRWLHTPTKGGAGRGEEALGGAGRAGSGEDEGDGGGGGDDEASQTGGAGEDDGCWVRHTAASSAAVVTASAEPNFPWLFSLASACCLLLTAAIYAAGTALDRWSVKRRQGGRVMMSLGTRDRKP